jgi:hypothetical protein
MAHILLVVLVISWLFATEQALKFTTMFKFTVTRSVETVSRLIDIPLSRALEALHDPPTLIQLNPLVTRYEASASDPNFYTITDKLVVFGLWTMETKYKVKFVTVDDGVDVSVTAGLGTKVTNRWRTRTVENKTEIREEATLEVRFWLVCTMITHSDNFFG